MTSVAVRPPLKQTQSLASIYSRAGGGALAPSSTHLRSRGLCSTGHRERRRIELCVGVGSGSWPRMSIDDQVPFRGRCLLREEPAFTGALLRLC